MAEQNANNPCSMSPDLPEQLRQICDALWAASERKDRDEMNSLLDRRETLMSTLSKETVLSDRERRELLAVQAADKYLMRQLSTELEWLEKRLNGLAMRKTATRGYRTKAPARSHLTRTG